MADNPYVGPRSIKTGEAFWGRDREIRSLSALLLAERIVLLHSPSGAGKSSLIEAGLRPRMEERFRVSPLVRVNLEIPQELRGMIGLNRYLISTLLSLEEAWPLAQRLPLTELATLSLNAYLEKRALPDDAFENSLLLFDQFEEVLTVSPADAPAKQQFFEQLGEALQNRRRWALFAIREDYMGGLAPYVRTIPNRLNVPFRLGLLGTQAAKLAIQQPAKDKSVDFTDAAAQKLVDDLSHVHIQQPDGSFVSQPGPDVEPVQLQVVCFNLWQHLPNDVNEITAADLSTVGSVDESLAQYYATSVADVAAQTGAPERELRTWFDKHLLTGSADQPVRSQVRKGAGSTEGLQNAAIDKLVDSHIIRAEPRAGSIWYELAHDRLIQPVRESNLHWFAANLKLFQKQALLWDQQGRGEGLLLRGNELQQAESEAKMLPLTPNENAFIESCQALRKREKDSLRQKRYILAGLVASLILLGTAIFFSYLLYNTTVVNHGLLVAAQTAEGKAQAASTEAVSQKNLAENEKATAEAAQANADEKAKIARAGELAAQSESLISRDFRSSLLLAIESFHFLDTPQTRSALLDTVVAHPELRQFIAKHKYTVASIAFSPNGKIFASGSYDRTIILWNALTSEPIGKPLTGHKDVVMSVAFSPDGKILASGSGDNTIILWDVATGKAIGQPLTGHTKLVWSVAFSPDGKTIASSSNDGTIILWDVLTGRYIDKLLFKKSAGAVVSVAFSPDGKILASGQVENTVILWNVLTKKPIYQPFTIGPNSPGVLSVAFSPDGKILAVGSVDGSVTLWDVLTGKLINRITQHTNAVTSVAFSPNGNILASGSYDQTIMLWDISTSQPIGQPITTPNNIILSVAFSPDGKTLASSSASSNMESTLILWNISLLLDKNGSIYKNNIGQPLTIHTGTSYQHIKSSVSFSPDSKILASIDDDKIILWDVTSGKRIGQPITGHTDWITSIAFSPDGKTLASGSWDDTIILWDLASRKAIGQPLVGHTNWVTSVTFSPDGKTLASGSDDKTIILWDVVSGKIIGQPFTGHTDAVTSVAFSPDGKIMASGSNDKVIILWDVATHKAIGQSLIGHLWPVTSVAFSPDGKVIASAGNDGYIILWDVATHKAIGQPLARHTESVASVAFSPDGRILASGSSDKTIILWDVVTRSAIGQPISGHTNAITSVAFSPDGKFLASGGDDIDNFIMLWDIKFDSWIAKSCQRVGRNFTSAEWETYFPNEPYRATCPQFGLEAEPTAVATP